MNGWGFSRNAYDMNDAKRAKTRGKYTSHAKLRRGALLNLPAASFPWQPTSIPGFPRNGFINHGFVQSVDSTRQRGPGDPHHRWPGAAYRCGPEIVQVIATFPACLHLGSSTPSTQDNLTCMAFPVFSYWLYAMSRIRSTRWGPHRMGTISDVWYIPWRKSPATPVSFPLWCRWTYTSPIVLGNCEDLKSFW